MRHRLRRLVLGAPGFIEISKDDFEQLKHAHQRILDVLNIEATFDLLLENYAEFERDLLGLSHRLSLFREHGEPLGPHREMNRRIANLLSSARLYICEVPQDLNAIYGRSSPHAKFFEQCCSKQYDSSLAYRALEALWNYAQHCGFPVHAMTLRFEREGADSGSLLRAGLQLFVEVQRLKRDGKFKKRVLSELEPKADPDGYINLTSFVPEYMEKLCKVHESLRDRISVDVSSWDQIIISAVQRARATFGEKFSGLSSTLSTYAA